MKPNIRSFESILFIVLGLSLAGTGIIKAQEAVTEPPLPIYVVCPYHEDSLKAVFESSSASSGLSLSLAMKKYDTLQTQIQRSSAESTAHFTWLYALVALLGTMNIVLLFSTSRIRKELSQIRRFEHQHKLVPVEPHTSPLVPAEGTVGSTISGSTAVLKTSRTRKPTVKKS
jgi:hypothetical protein